MRPKHPARSDRLFRWFRRYARWYVGRRFHAVRVSRQGRPPALPDTGVIVSLNHPSWWDPMICLLLTDLFPERTHYAPIDARALNQYSFFRKLGFYGVEQNTLRGAKQFLETSRAVLGDPAAMLWITAQGRFADVRERPLQMMPGIQHLSAPVLPVAIEYAFWTESKPEALVRFGPLNGDLEQTQNALAEEVIRRDESEFVTLLGGTSGVGGIYDVWRRAKARMQGKTFRPEHSAIFQKEVRS